MLDGNRNPASEAAQIALDSLYRAIDEKKNFLFEAGAGAGKTYSLIKALEYIINTKGKIFAKAHKRIACITFTNVAKEQIDQRIDKHPVVHSDTIHAFCWSVIKNFPDEIRKALPTIARWPERIEGYFREESFSAVVALENGDGEDTDAVTVDYLEVIGRKPINYQLGYPSIDEDGIMLGHDDILHLMVHFLSKLKFRNVLFSRYPIILIDEYQDTYAGFAQALQTHFIDAENGPQIGFFGDHWQKIYGNGCGQIANEKLVFIPKNANFRSVSTIVNVLNAMRPGLQQHVEDPSSTGNVAVYHTNEWVGTRRTGSHWADDLPAEQAHDYLTELRLILESEGWQFTPEKTKILMLTHNVLAQEQGYKDLASVFSSNDAFIKKEDKFIAYFVDFLEPVCEAFSSRKYGEMFSIIGAGRFGINSHGDKVEWSARLTTLLQLRLTGSIGDVLDFLLGGSKPKVPEYIVDACKRFSRYVPEEGVDEPSEIRKIRAMRDVPYKQVIELKKFVTDHTPFATKHSVKGEQYENVLVVVGRGWNQYNFVQMLAWFEDGVPPGKEDTFERSRNLFYVACSRPQKRLAVLFTQKVSDPALVTLQKWFGVDNVVAMPSALPLLN